MQHYLKMGKNFAFPDYSPRYPRDPEYRLKHYCLEVSLNVVERSVTGKATLTIAPLRKPVKLIELDAVMMDIQGVESDIPHDYEYDGARLVIKLDKPISSELSFSVKYRAKPKTGLYFMLPDEHYPERVPTIWSQGEPEYHRYWMPIYDYPNNKCTSEIIATLPSEYTVVSNGELLSVRDNEDGTKTWHWRMDKPHSTYLISLVAGIFGVAREGVGGVELEYYVPRGREADIERSFSKTADMLRFFSEYTGVPYPFKRYSQVCVTEFVVGGMENTTATTLTDLTLHDEHAHMDFTSDPLVAHELAHQWFGDLVTIKDWAHIWLNESFATYFENLYLLKDKGFDEFVYELLRDLHSYLEEYERRYSRPIVMRLYKYPEELFDGHAYPKGSLVLHTLRNLLGEEDFRRGVKLFLERHAYGNADTEDLRKAMEDASGQNLEWFFDQFVYSAGHPALKVRYQWDGEAKVIKLYIKQTQGEDAPEAYNLSLDVVLNYDDSSKSHSLKLAEREVVIYLPSDERPWHLCIDPEFKVFKSLEVERSVEENIQVLKRCRYVYCRLDAARALGVVGGFRAVEALEEALRGDPFWGVSAAAARALGEVASDDARDVLIRSLEVVKHPKVRNAVAEALGRFRQDEKAAAKLCEILNQDSESYYVRQQAASSLGRIRLVKYQSELIKALDKPSHNYVITSGALQGLAELGTEEALGKIMEYTRLGKPTPVRITATISLAKFPGRREVYERLDELARDKYDRVRLAVVQAAREMLDPKLLPTLDYMAEKDLNERIRRGAREVSKKIRENMERGVEYKALREEIEKIREENRRLVERIARFESKGV